MSADPADWRFRQVFGEKDSSEESAEEDLVSSVEFDETGKYLATGDRCGRIVIFESTHDTPSQRSANERQDNGVLPEYHFLCEFQSHEPEFDYLKSLEIEERINRIRWCRGSGSSGPLLLLSTNDKTIKLWKIYEKKVKMVSAMNVEKIPGHPAMGSRFSTSDGLKIPSLTVADTVVMAMPRRVYSDGHAYHINSISVNCDGETYLSADDLRINMWHLNFSNQSFNVVDIKPTDMEDLAEVITAAEFHPSSCNYFMYSSSKGSIRLCDLRQSALCNTHSKIFEDQDLSNKSFFSEVISSISDIKFSNDGRYIMSRDYMSVKIWDVNMEARPLQTILVHEHLRPKLCELYQTDCIFDKFECGWSGDGKRIVTGGYQKKFHIFDPLNGRRETSVDTTKSSVLQSQRAKSSLRGKLGGGFQRTSKDASMESVDWAKKILHHSYHPQMNLVAVASSNSLFIFHAT